MKNVSALFFAALAAACSTSGEAPAEFQITAQQKAEIERAVAAKLKDPSSAIFGPMRVGTVAGAPAVCGWVNGRNAFGAYAGTEIYYARLENGHFNASPPGDTSRSTCMLMGLLPPQP